MTCSAHGSYKHCVNTKFMMIKHAQLAQKAIMQDTTAYDIFEGHRLTRCSSQRASFAAAHCGEKLLQASAVATAIAMLRCSVLCSASMGNCFTATWCYT
jgi:hypothetical protein